MLWLGIFPLPLVAPQNNLTEISNESPNKDLDMPPATDMFHALSCLEHGLQIVSHLEGGLSLALDLIDGDTVGNLHKREALGKVYIKDTLAVG